MDISTIKENLLRQLDDDSSGDYVNIQRADHAADRCLAWTQAYLYLCQAEMVELSNESLRELDD